jgi:archaellum component FlaC
VLDATASSKSSSQFLPNHHQSSQLVIELSEQVATLSSELEQAKRTINQLQQQRREQDEENL